MKEKIILITGANRGIGFETATQLLKMGHAVVVAARDSSKAADTALKLQTISNKVDFVVLDILDETAIQLAAKVVEEKYGRLDVLINNAGIFQGHENSLAVSKEQVQAHLNTNFLAPLRISQVFLPLLQKSAEGRIINISSQMGRLNGMVSGAAAYRFSKTAINSLTAVMAADLADSTIKINSMCPGWVKTDMGGSNAPGTVQEGADTAVWLATAEQIPTGKFFANRQVTEW